MADPRKGKRKPLSPAQRAFVDAYVDTGNAAEACRRAYPRAKDPAKRGSAVLRHPLVAAEVARLREAVEARSDVSRQAVVDRLWLIGQGDDRDRVPALSQLCKIMGYNAPEAVEVTVTGAASRLRDRILQMLDRVDHAQPDA